MITMIYYNIREISENVFKKNHFIVFKCPQYHNYFNICWKLIIIII